MEERGKTGHLLPATVDDLGFTGILWAAAALVDMLTTPSGDELCATQGWDAEERAVRAAAVLETGAALIAAYLPPLPETEEVIDDDELRRLLEEDGDGDHAA